MEEKELIELLKKYQQEGKEIKDEKLLDAMLKLQKEGKAKIEWKENNEQKCAQTLRIPMLKGFTPLQKSMPNTILLAGWSGFTQQVVNLGNLKNYKDLDDAISKSFNNVDRQVKNNNLHTFVWEDSLINTRTFKFKTYFLDVLNSNNSITRRLAYAFFVVPEHNEIYSISIASPSQDMLEDVFEKNPCDEKTDNITKILSKMLADVVNFIEYKDDTLTIEEQIKITKFLNLRLHAESICWPKLKGFSPVKKEDQSIFISESYNGCEYQVEAMGPLNPNETFEKRIVVGLNETNRYLRNMKGLSPVSQYRFYKDYDNGIFKFKIFYTDIIVSYAGKSTICRMFTAFFIDNTYKDVYALSINTPKFPYPSQTGIKIGTVDMENDKITKTTLNLLFMCLDYLKYKNPELNVRKEEISSEEKDYQTKMQAISDRFKEKTNMDLRLNYDNMTGLTTSWLYADEQIPRDKEEFILFLNYHVDKYIAKKQVEFMQTPKNDKLQEAFKLFEQANSFLSPEKQKEKDFEKLCRKVLKNFLDEEAYPRIKSILETKDWFIFTSGIPNLEVTQPYAIKVNKLDGHIEPFLLPSEEGFKLLKEAKELEIPKEFKLEDKHNIAMGNKTGIKFATKWLEQCVRDYLNKPLAPLNETDLARIKYIKISDPYNNKYSLEISENEPPTPYCDPFGGEEWESATMSTLAIAKKIMSIQEQKPSSITLSKGYGDDSSDYEYDTSTIDTKKCAEFEKSTIKYQDNNSGWENNTNALVNDLSLFKSLKVLRIYEIQLNDFRIIQNLSNLRVLELKDVAFASSEGIESLVKLDQLCAWVD